MCKIDTIFHKTEIAEKNLFLVFDQQDADSCPGGRVARGDVGRTQSVSVSPPCRALATRSRGLLFFLRNCRSLIKVKFPTDQLRPALGSCCCSMVTMLKKPQNCPISDFFDLTPIYFLSLLHYTDPVPPSSDPVPPSTKQYRLLLNQYHHISTIAALC